MWPMNLGPRYIYLCIKLLHEKRYVLIVLGIVLSWNMSVSEAVATIANYQLFAYQEGSAPPHPNLWKKVCVLYSTSHYIFHAFEFNFNPSGMNNKILYNTLDFNYCLWFVTGWGCESPPVAHGLHTHSVPGG